MEYAGINNCLNDFQQKPESVDNKNHKHVTSTDIIKEFKFDLELENIKFTDLDAKLYSLMNDTADKVNEIQPIVTHVKQKIAAYDEQRQHDTVTLVGSIGNELYFPEKTDDGSFLLEIDVLYNREIPNVVLPIPKSPVITAEIEFKPQRTLPIGVHFLKITSNPEEIDKSERFKYFAELENENTYLKTLGFTCFIPRKKDPSILGEVEIDDISKASLLPLFRTCRTDLQNMCFEGKEFMFRILVDKVFALKAPWPHTVSNFKERERKWPDKMTVENVVDAGCLLTHRTSLMAFTLQWKITFALAEQVLTKRFTFHQQYLFILIKLINKKFLDMGVFENGESRIGLTSYHLKTIYLWMCESRDAAQFSKNPGKCFRVFFKILKTCIDRQICPHFFIPEINVMSGLGYYKKPLTENDEKWLSYHRNLKESLQQAIKIIIEKPLLFLNSELFEVVDEKHLYDLGKGTD